MGEPVRNEKGEITGVTVAAVDITEKKHLEQMGRESQMQLELQRKLMKHREQERLTIAQEIHDGPLQTIIVALFDLEMTKAASNDPALQTGLDEIELNLKAAMQELRGVIGELRPPLLERFGISKAMQGHADELNEKYPDLELTHDIEEDQGNFSEEARLGLFRIYQEALSNIVRIQ